MTHDELLAEIDSRKLHPAQDITNHKTWEHKAKLYDALRAVVELHKPAVNLEFPYQPICRECANLIDPWNENSYPCPTIRAIEKELK